MARLSVVQEKLPARSLCTASRALLYSCRTSDLVAFTVTGGGLWLASELFTQISRQLPNSTRQTTTHRIEQAFISLVVAAAVVQLPGGPPNMDCMRLTWESNFITFKHKSSQYVHDNLCSPKTY